MVFHFGNHHLAWTNVPPWTRSRGSPSNHGQKTSPFIFWFYFYFRAAALWAAAPWITMIRAFGFFITLSFHPFQISQPFITHALSTLMAAMDEQRLCTQSQLPNAMKSTPNVRKCPLKYTFLFNEVHSPKHTCKPAAAVEFSNSKYIEFSNSKSLIMWQFGSPDSTARSPHTASNNKGNWHNIYMCVCNSKIVLAISKLSLHPPGAANGPAS